MGEVAWWALAAYAAVMVVVGIRLAVVARQCGLAIDVSYNLSDAWIKDPRRTRDDLGDWRKFSNAYSVDAFYHWRNMFDLTKWTWRQMAPELDRLEREHRS